VPFNLEDELRNRGAHYTKAALPFASHVVEEGLLITGENPASAAPVAEAVVKRLRSAEPAAREVVGVAT
jgi:putative intracellular protease/amidase